MPCAAPRGSLPIALRAADTNSGLTSIRALRMSFCKAFWVLGFVERACSSTFLCSTMTVSSISSPNIKNARLVQLYTNRAKHGLGFTFLRLQRIGGVATAAVVAAALLGVVVWVGVVASLLVHVVTLHHALALDAVTFFFQ